MGIPGGPAAFLSLTMSLEALLGTGANEIAHQIAERAAVVVGKVVDQKVSLYKRVKQLYSLRSKLVHGTVAARKGPIGWETTYMTAIRSNVAVSECTELANITARVIYTLVMDKKYRGTVEQRNDDVSDYFAHRPMR